MALYQGLPYDPFQTNPARSGESFGSPGESIDLSTAVQGAESHDDAMASIQAEAMRRSLSMQRAAQEFRQKSATQNINQFKQSTREARRFAASELGNLTSSLPQGMAGWEENFLNSLTPEGVAMGAAGQAASHLGAIKEAVSFGVVKDLSDLLGA